MRIEKIIRRGREFAILPLAEFKKLVADAEMLADVKAYDAVKARLERGEDERIPLALTERRLGGGNPLKIWRTIVGSLRKAWRGFLRSRAQ